MTMKLIGIFICIAACLTMVSGCSRTPVTGFDGAAGLGPCPGSPNCVSSQEEDEAHRIAPLTYEGSREAAFERLRTLVSEIDNARIISEKSYYLHAEFKSRWFKFIDDVEFWFPETEDGNGIIHMRSASRLGYSDLGVNRKRMEEIRGLFTGSGKSM